MEALSWLGIVELAAGRPERCGRPLDEAFALPPDDLNAAGNSWSSAQPGGAGELWAHGADQPGCVAVHQIRAELFASESKDREAVAEYEAALAKENRNPDLYEGLGDAYRRLNELDAAQKAYAHELELSRVTLSPCTTWVARMWTVASMPRGYRS